MKQVLMPLVALVALAACEPEIPDSAAGVGFDDYASYQTVRESRLQGQATVLPPVTAVPISEEQPRVPMAAPVPAPMAAPAPQAVAAPDPVGAPLSALSSERVAAAPISTAPIAAAPAAQPDATEPAPIVEDEIYQPAAGAPIVREPAPGTTGQAIVPIEPAPVPQRSGTAAPNIVSYALNTRNQVGQPRYRRTNPLRYSSFERNCGRYPSDDLAQEAFLAAGGPDRDRLNLDPDGDGFACRWDPAPFRQAVN